jgi:hypothetical protein
MTKALVLAVAVGAILVLPGISAGSSASGNTYRVSASMNTRQVVTPKNRPWKAPASVRNARGSLRGTMTVKGRRGTLAWHITYTGVGSSPLQIADIHYGKPRHFGPILVRLCGPCKSGQSGTKKLSAAAVNSIKAGTAWITIITGKYRNGVIRGQIRASS